MVINGNSHRVRGLLDYHPDQLTLSVRGDLVGGTGNVSRAAGVA